MPLDDRATTCRDALLALGDWLTTNDGEIRVRIMKKVNPVTTNQEDREDLAQNIPLRMWCTYQHQKKCCAVWWTLLKRIIRSAACDLVRRQRRDPRIAPNSTMLETCPAKTGGTPDTARNGMIEVLHALNRALKRIGRGITDEQILILVYRFCDDATFQKNASAIGRSTSDVHKKFHEALDELRSFEKTRSFLSGW